MKKVVVLVALAVGFLSPFPVGSANSAGNDVDWQEFRGLIFELKWKTWGGCLEEDGKKITRDTLWNNTAIYMRITEVKGGGDSAPTMRAEMIYPTKKRGLVIETDFKLGGYIYDADELWAWLDKLPKAFHRGYGDVFFRIKFKNGNINQARIRSFGGWIDGTQWFGNEGCLSEPRIKGSVVEVYALPEEVQALLSKKKLSPLLEELEDD